MVDIPDELLAAEQLAAPDLPDGEDRDPTRLQALNRRVSRPLAAVSAIPNLPIFAGLGLVVLGGVVLLVAWGRTAGEHNVALQLPYVVSGGFIGLALVAVGLIVVSVAAKAADAAA